MDKQIYTRRANRSAEGQLEAVEGMVLGTGAFFPESASSDAIGLLLEKVASGEIDTILVTEIERLASDPEEAKAVLSKLQSLGVKVIEA